MTVAVAPVRPWREAPIYTARLLRATTMQVKEYGEGTFHVTSYSGTDDRPHWVNLSDTECQLCDCEDASYRDDTLCAHALAALLFEADQRTWNALAKHQLLAFRTGRLVLTVLPSGPKGS